VGNPRNESVRMGALVSREQFHGVLAGIEHLKTEAEVLYDGAAAGLVDADPAVAACVAPVLLGTQDPVKAKVLHEVEVFGPVATLMPYDSESQAWELIRRGEGSLVASVYSERPGVHRPGGSRAGRQPWPRARHQPDVAASQTGHGNVMPSRCTVDPAAPVVAKSWVGCARWASTTGAAPCRPAPPHWTRWPQRAYRSSPEVRPTPQETGDRRQTMSHNETAAPPRASISPVT
jgi:hypothetical protein